MVVWRLSRRHDSWILGLDNFYISGVCYDFNQATDLLDSWILGFAIE